jgi:hypothetical protein
VETKPNCFLLPQSVLNFLHSARLTGALVAEQPLDAEYDGKYVERRQFDEANAWDKPWSYGNTQLKN